MSMEFRFQFLTVMQEQNPKLYRRLRKLGELDRFVDMKSREAAQMFQELTKDAPKEPSGYPQQPWAREAEEQVKALLFEFPDEQIGPAQDEINAFNEPSPPQSLGMPASNGKLSMRHHGMQLGSRQHQKMASLLYKRACDVPDDRKREKIIKMAQVFRTLARRAAEREGLAPPDSDEEL